MVAVPYLTLIERGSSKSTMWIQLFGGQWAKFISSNTIPSLAGVSRLRSSI